MTENVCNLLDNLTKHNSRAFGYELSQNEVLQILKLFDDVKELEQYRAIGTVARFEQLSKQFLPHNTDETSCNLRSCNKCDIYRKENEKYHEIGTIEEFKALKEKSVAKKVKGKHMSDSLEERQLCGEYTLYGYCPNCGENITNLWNSVNCGDCGQRLDWK